MNRWVSVSEGPGCELENLVMLSKRQQEKAFWENHVG